MDGAGTPCWVAWRTWPLWAGLHQATQSSPSPMIPAPLGWGWWEAQPLLECAESGEGRGRASLPGAKASRPLPAGLGAASSRKVAQTAQWLCLLAPSEVLVALLRLLPQGLPPDVHTGAQRNGTHSSEFLQSTPSHQASVSSSAKWTNTPSFQGQSEDSRRHLELQREESGLRSQTVIM